VETVKELGRRCRPFPRPVLPARCQNARYTPHRRHGRLAARGAPRDRSYLRLRRRLERRGKRSQIHLAQATVARVGSTAPRPPSIPQNTLCALVAATLEGTGIQVSPATPRRRKTFEPLFCRPPSGINQVGRFARQKSATISCVLSGVSAIPAKPGTRRRAIRWRVPGDSEKKPGAFRSKNIHVIRGGKDKAAGGSGRRE